MIHGRQGACALALAAVFAVGGSASTIGAAQAAPASTTVVAATTAKAKPLRVTAKPSTVRIVSGQTLTVTGKVTNADASTRVVLQTRTEDGWANLGRPAALNRGSFKFTTRPATVGPQAFRVVALAKGRSAGSPAFSTKVYGWIPLVSLQRVNAWDSREDLTASVNGRSYSRSWMGYDHGFMEYNLRRDCLAFRGVAGMSDDSQTGRGTTISVLRDGQLVAEARVTTGMSQPLTADIAGAFRLTLRVAEAAEEDSGISDQAVVGTPEVLCGFTTGL